MDIALLPEDEVRPPTYRLIKAAFSPGDTIFVLDENEIYCPVEIKEIQKKAFVTDIGDITYVDHGWLWRCFEPKEE